MRPFHAYAEARKNGAPPSTLINTKAIAVGQAEEKQWSIRLAVRGVKRC
jgi:hypothetical protein